MFWDQTCQIFNVQDVDSTIESFLRLLGVEIRIVQVHTLAVLGFPRSSQVAIGRLRSSQVLDGDDLRRLGTN